MHQVIGLMKLSIDAYLFDPYLERILCSYYSIGHLLSAIEKVWEIVDRYLHISPRPECIPVVISAA